MTEFLKSKIVKNIVSLGGLIVLIYGAASTVTNINKQVEINKLTNDLNTQKALNESLNSKLVSKDSMITSLKGIISNNKLNKNGERKRLIVYNNTNKMRFFQYSHPESRKGAGYPINPKSKYVFNLEGNSFKYDYYGYEGSTNSSPNEEKVLDSGEFNLSVNGYEIIILDK